VFTLSAAAGGPASAAFLHRGLAAVDSHRNAVVPLPQPFGERRCLGFAAADAGWLGGIAEGRVIRTYMCIIDDRQSGRAGDEPVAHWVAVRRRARLLGARTIECRGRFLHAARSAAVFAEALCHRPARPGCLDPDELFALAELEPQLLAAGISVVTHQLGPEIDRPIGPSRDADRDIPWPT
jgi:hypothetical protein